MNLDSLSFALYNISYSVANLTKKNFKLCVQEISRLVALHGLEAERYLIRCLFSHVDFSGDCKSSGKDFHQIQYLIQECSTLIYQPHFISTFLYAVDKPLQQQKSLKPSSQLLHQISKVLKLSKFQEIAFGIALLHSESTEHQENALAFLKEKLPKFLKLYAEKDSEEQTLPELDEHCLLFLFPHLLERQKEFEVTDELRKSFARSVRKVEHRGAFKIIKDTSVLRPYLYFTEDFDTIIEPDMEGITSLKPAEDHVVDLIKEMGYAFTASLEDCRNNAQQVGLREPSPAIVARILSMMARSHSGLSDPINLQSMNSNNVIMWGDGKEKTESSSTLQGWNIEVFVQVLHEILSNLDWKEVVCELDHPGFLLSDRQGLRLLWQALIMGLGHELFPMDVMYRRWRNAEGQFSFFQQVINCPEVVCLVDYSHRPVTIDALKAPPEEDNRGISNWKSLDLIETLLTLSETPYFKDDIVKFPVNQCPDLLLLGLIQTNRNINQYHKDLLGRLIPVFLNNHPNSAIVLHLAWHSQVHQSAVKNILMQSMADWYVRSEFDQTKLSRILDVAQDLKALSMLLNVTPFVFVIDLACLASRREYLKLDKWLADKIREHGEAFVQNCISFLRRRCPQAGGNTKEENPPKTALPPETLAVICHVLQSLVGNVSPELSETIVTVVNSCMVWNSSRTGTGKNARGIESVLSSGTVNPPSSSLDPLSGLSSSVSGMSLVPSAKTSLSSSSVFPVPRDLHPFPTSTSLGSPIKMLPLTTPTTTASSVNQLSQPFSLSSQLPQFGSQLLAGDMSAVFPELSHPVSKEIEDEANGYFQRIYNHPPHPTLSIDEVLEMLKRFMESPVQREKDVFFCMIRNLLEEYRFFPQYPDKELMTTAQLFGGIIEHNLVKESSSSVQRQGRPSKSYLILGVALRYVIDSLKKAQGSKMFYFGVTAMDKFKNRLKDYPQICQYISSLPTYHDLPPPLIEYIDYGVRSQEPPARVQGATVQPSLPTMTSTFAGLSTAGVNPLALTTAVVTATSSATKNTMAGKPSIANATNIDTLLGATEKDEKLTLPPESVQDKVAFIVNNLSQSNLLQKTDEFREVVKEDYWPWTSQYMVMKRASIEPNFHSLYSNFLDTLKLLQLTELIIRETFRNIKVLLRSDKGIANFSDRSLLKNLGHWLGMLTLAKSKPILHIDIDIKSLLIEAYHNGQEELLYVVPFIAKVLESCAKSRAFKPPNPWTMGIMNTLAELHKEQDLKLNLKFEIEVLCKTLTLDINDLKPKNILKDPERVVRLELQLSPLLKTKEVVMVTTTNVVVMPQKPISTVVGPATNTLPNAPMPAEETITVAPNVTTNSPPSAIVSSTSTAQTVMPQPQFAYNDINVCNVSGLHQHMVVNGQLNLFQAHSQLKQCIRPALERAVQEWIIPVVERSIKISLTTCEQLIKKDFALDPEENRMRMSAHHMIRYLTAGMAMITCKDPLVMSISQNLKSAFGSALRNANPQQKEMIEQAAQVVAQDNVELACCFIQKTAVEKALPEIDKRLNSEYDLRKLAKNEGRLYCDAAVLTYQAERIPEPIRLKVGNVTPQQMAVYEEFLKTIPGFLPSDREHHTSFMKAVLPQMPLYGSDDLTPMYDKIINDLELLLLNIIAPGNHHLTALHSLLECVASARSSREVMASLNLLVKGTVEGLLDGLAHITSDPEILHRFRDGHLIVLKTIAEQRIVGQQYVTKLVARSIIESREELRYNLEATDVLIRNHLVDMPSYDILLAQILLQVLEKGLNYVAVSFAMQLVKLYLIDDKQSGLVSEADLLNTIDTLARLATARQGPDGLGQLLELLRSSSETVFIDRAPGSSGPMSMMHSGITQAREFDDPPGLHEKTEFLLREWVTMYHAPNSGRDSTKAFSIFVHQMNVHGILKTDELITRFFRISTEMCSELVFRSLIDNSASPTLARAKCFHTVDAFVRLIALLVKHSGDTSNSTTKLNLLNKVLGIIAGVLLTEQEGRGVDFQQLTYHRIFIMLFLELSLPDAVLEALSAQIVQAFANTFFFVRPQKAPSFAYAWLELVSHRVFLGRLLAVSPQPKSWGLYAQLLISLFKFLSPFLRNVELAQPIHILYKGTLRVLLVLLHDFPEFLCDYHYHFCDAIAPNCIQMRNLILSAFPRNMRLPDPFTPNLKVDLLTDIKQTPRMVANFGSAIQPDRFKTDLDSYIKTRSPVNFLVDLRTNLQNATNEPGMRYNIPLINALVLYVGTQAIGHIQSKGLTPSMNTITHSSHMDIFQSLAVDLDTEGRYLFLNAIANQLRYPNSHTHYFSCTLLYLFMEANTEAIQEQITRVLLERLIVNRPHPWGLLITFIELIKNTSFKFWNHDFVRCAPEIEKLFESVARSCMHPKPSTEASSS